MTTQCVCVCARSLSHVQLFVILWTVACQAPPSMELSRQEYWNGLLFSPPGDLNSPGIKPSFPASATLAGSFFSAEPSGKKMCWVLQRQMDLAIRGHCTHFRNVSQSVGSRISTFQIQIMLLTETGDNVSVSPLWPLVRSLKGTWLSSVQAACSGYMIDSYWNKFLRCWHLW